MGSRIRDHMRLFLLSILNEDPRLLSLCTLNELTSVFVQEMNIELSEKSYSNLKHFVCCFLYNLMNEEGIGTNGVDPRVQNNCLPVKNASSAPPETQRRVVMLSRDEVIALAAATVIDKTNPVVSASNGGESVSKRIKQLRQTPLIGTRPTIRTLVNKSAIINESNGPSASHVEVTPLRNIQLIPTPRTESSTQKIESFSKSNCARNLLTTISTSNLSAFMSQSSVNDRRSYISAPSSSLNPTSNSINNIKNISATKTGITIKRQLSEAVISIRPATSRLLDNN
ncbi:hypothetical protein KSF78_0001121 [Schistosoma japonicum]|uniref:SJCHGC02675 protein n=1 Tax=Schistosoma japonicum TaxID=6182 RepID=Q5DER8_SCHJA|nr:SJCHGC02675 protein [Schistosoma japonicum]KAH8852424.1 hypothetical protein KSF78_0001121 [Schistosoma japonicum]KAH8852428.1 hypothetical protein KSF78_0001121 [Schistosoma japonicum]KAH8852429.1 hypothetical protein KSF78_0001121 [Schistosoma japonicum]